MIKLSQKGIAHIFVLLILALGLIALLYLVQNQTKLFPKASTSGPTAPETSFTLVDVNGSVCDEILCRIFTQSSVNGAVVKVDLFARSDIESANLFSAKLSFPTELLEVTSIETTGEKSSAITNWVENIYDNNAGTIDLTGGVPDPGIQSQMGDAGLYIATIIFKSKKEGRGTISFNDSSAIYSNLNNINILTVKRNLDLEITQAAEPTTVPSAQPYRFEIGMEAGAQRDTSKVDLVSDSGSGWVRLNFIGSNWNSGSSDVSLYNNIINAYTQKGIKILGLIGAESVPGGYDRNWPDEFSQKYLETAEAIISRFGDRVKTYELFNEPNDWAGGNSSQMSAQYFARNLARVYRAVKINGNKTDITLLSGPLFSADITTAADYLLEVYNIGKSSEGWEQIKSTTGSYPLDGIGYHLYVAQGMNDQGNVESKIQENLDAIKSVLDQNDTGKKIWISEIGWGTGQDRVSENVQAANLRRAFNSLNSRSDVALALWFTLQDFDSSEWGLIRGDGVKKQAWYSFKETTGRLLLVSPAPSTTSAPVPTPVPGTGDGNGDGRVNLADLSVLLSDYNKNNGFRTSIDLNGDGVINAFDFGLMRNLLIQNGVIKG